MIPLNTSYHNPNGYLFRGRATYPWFRQGFNMSPIFYSNWSWSNYIPVTVQQGRAQRSQPVSYYPSRTIYTSCGGYCGWRRTDAVYSSQGLDQLVGGSRPSYTSRGRYHGRSNFDRNSGMDMYNDHRFYYPDGGTVYRHVIYYRSSPAATYVTRQPGSAFSQPSAIPMLVADNTANFHQSVALDSLVLPPLMIPRSINDDEYYYGSIEKQELNGKHVSLSGDNSPQAAQRSSYSTQCSFYHCTDMSFFEDSSGQSDTESASTYATGDGWSSPVSPSCVTVEPVDQTRWNNNLGNECFGNYQESQIPQATSSPPMCRSKPQDWRQQQQAHFGRQCPVSVPPQFYQKPMGAYGPDPQGLCQQQNYIGYHYVSGQYIQMGYLNNGMWNEQSVHYGTPLNVEIPEDALVQLLTNGTMLESSFQQPNQMQDFHNAENWNTNEMLVTTCPDNKPSVPRKSVPEVWDQEYEKLPKYDDLVMAGSPLVSRYFPTVPVECAEATYSTETKNATTTFPAPASIYQSKHIPRKIPQQAMAGLLAGGGTPRINEIIHASFTDNSIGQMVNERLDLQEMNDRRRTSFSSFNNYYDTHNQPDGAAGNSSMGTHSIPNGNVGSGAPTATIQGVAPAQQQPLMGLSGNQQRQQNGRRAERDSDVSNITLKSLLETPYSPRTRNARNLELEEYQIMLAEDELQKKLDALKAKDLADKKEKNGCTTIATENAED